MFSKSPYTLIKRPYNFNFGFVVVTVEFQCLFYIDFDFLVNWIDVEGKSNRNVFKLAVFKSWVPNWTSDIVSDCLHTVGCCVLTNYKYTLMDSLDWMMNSLSLCAGSTREWRWARHWLLFKSRWVILFLQSPNLIFLYYFGAPFNHFLFAL